MKLGEVYIWETSQVQVHDKRVKRHVFICPQDHEELNFFLFINKRDWFKDHKILLENYKGFLEYDSFVGGNTVARYSSAYLSKLNLHPAGTLSVDDLKSVRDAIIAAETMVQRDMNRVCKALAAIL